MLGRFSLCLLMIAACGGGGGDDPPAGVDAPPGNDTDAPPATVVEVTCPGGEAASVESTGGFRFSPDAVTITVGQVVKFTNASNHSIVPVFPDSDPGLKVGFGATTCLM